MGWGAFYAVLSAMCFGSLAILAKLGLGMGMSPLEVVQYRFGFGAVLLFSWLLITRPGLLKASPRTLLKAAVLGWGLYPFQSYFFIKALQYIPASTTSLIYYFYPMGTTLLAVAFLKLRPGRILYVSLGIIMAGCGLVFHHAFARNMEVRGILYALACMAVFSCYLTLIQVFTKNGEAKAISAWVVLCMAVAFSALSPPTTILSKPLAGWAVALGLGLVPTALGISLIYRAIETIGSAMTAILSTIEPVVTVLLAALFLDEHVEWVQILGMACIVAGIAIPNIHLARQKNTLEHTAAP